MINKIIKYFIKRITNIPINIQIRIIKIFFNNKPLTLNLQNKIRMISKLNYKRYYYSEKKARNVANNWNGIFEKPEDISYIENAIPIVLSANVHYAPYLSVMLQSLIDNSNKNKIYHFIILERYFSNTIKNYIYDQINNNSNCKLDFINMENVYKNIPIALVSNRFSLDILSRLFIPYILEKYPKIIYCDSDMIAKADIADLFDINIYDHCLGSILSPNTKINLDNRTYSYFYKKTVFLLLDNWKYYIQSGVLMFNTKKFLEKISFQECFKLAIYYTNRYKIRLDDQDILSLLVKDDIFPLPSEWNFTWTFVKNDKVYYRNSELNTKLLHFTRKLKPWNNIPELINNPDVIMYKNYAKNVPLFRDYILNNK